MIITFTAQKYPSACSSKTFLSTPVLGFFFSTKSPGKIFLPRPSGCITIFLFLRALRPSYSASQDELVERLRKTMLHDGSFVVPVLSIEIVLCRTRDERTLSDVTFGVVDLRLVQRIGRRMVVADLERIAGGTRSWCAMAIVYITWLQWLVRVLFRNYNESLAVRVTWRE